MTGEGGTFARALSVVDIALWDLMGDLLKVPLWKLLGGNGGQVPCAAIAGYYRDDPVESIRQDAERLATGGYRIFKVPFGMDPEIDLKRIGAMRDVIGDESVIALDAGGVFNSHKAALQACLPLEKFNIAFFEDLFPAQAWELAVSFAQRYDLKVAFGESVSSPKIIQALGSANGVDIVRPDATHQLGITGYVQGVAPALENGVEVFPHYFPDIHAPLVGAIGGKMVEESPMEADTVGLRALRATQPEIRNGTWYLSERPGLGIEWDEDALISLRVVTP
jgi:L-alanine-DL-glutamate epimerase-like enolase superfamily enzyme